MHRILTYLLKRFSVVIALILIMTSCRPENDLHKNRDASVDLWLWQKTGKFYLVGRCGFFIHETSMYVITLKDTRNMYAFNEISITRDDSTLLLTNGYILMEKPGVVVVNLFENQGGKEVALNLNGKHKFKTGE